MNDPISGRPTPNKNMTSDKILVSLFSYNEGEKLKNLVKHFPEKRDYDILFVDDGSTDGSYEFLKDLKFSLIRHENNLGIGVGIREAIAYGQENNYQVIVIMAANGKMQPEEIDRLVSPIVNNGNDYVQGSRNLPGGQSPNLPLFRKIMIAIFTSIVNLFTGFKGTDITCGFRAYRLSLFDDPHFRLNQDWLGRYEMEYYIHYHVLMGRYKVTEVPVSMVYPESGQNYSKIKPFVGWWSMIRPWLYLFLKIKR
jgi:dolichol-phosphate mannosyltransferase